MYETENELNRKVCELYTEMLRETAAVLRSSNSARLHDEIVPLVDAHLRNVEPDLKALRRLRLSGWMKMGPSSDERYFSLSEKDYGKLEDIFSHLRKQIGSILEDVMDEMRTPDGYEQMRSTYVKLANSEKMLGYLIRETDAARGIYVSDAGRYLAGAKKTAELTADGPAINIILDDIISDGGYLQESAVFDTALEDLGNYVVSLLGVSGKKPISSILCRVNMKDADKILGTFGNDCSRGTVIAACHAVMALCKEYTGPSSADVLLKINDSMFTVRESCQFECEPLIKVNAVSYFMPRPSVIGFFDPLFPEIIFVRECEYASPQGIRGLSEGDIYDLHTAVHEYLHYCSHTSSQSGLISYSSGGDIYAETGFNEGLTEYLAITCMDEILDAREFVEGVSYPDQVAVVSELVRMFGRDFMISCYTSGDLERIGSAVNQVTGTPDDPDHWNTIAGYMSLLQKTMSGYGKNPDGTPLTWSQRQAIMKECRDSMLRILRKGRKK